MAQNSPTPARQPLTNWQGSPCPRCGTPLHYREDLPGGPEGWVLVLLVCERAHHWQERFNLKTLHSGVFVERRKDLEGRSATPAGAGTPTSP